MKTDPKSTLQLAFQQLEVFSIPGVGTFRRSHFPAHIDRETNIIRPPGERFILEKGERYVDRLEKFLARSISHGEEAVGKVPTGVSEIKAWLVRELKKGEELVVPGVGRLQLSKEKEVKFTADESLESQQGNFFGLQPLEFTLHGSPKEVEAKDKSINKPVDKEIDKPSKPIALAKTPVPNEVAGLPSEVAGVPNEIAGEPSEVAGVPEYVDQGEPEPPRKKRSRAWIWIILLLLLLGASATGVIMRDQVREQLVSWGWISGGGDNDGGGIVDKDGAGRDGLAIDGTDSTSVKGDSTNGTEDDWKDVEVNDSPDDGFEIVGTYAEPGVYYLVIASAKDPSNAKSLRGEMGGKVIRPRYQGNYHRVYSYKSTDKEQVIAKMVESKDKYPQSWIYWMGM